MNLKKLFIASGICLVFMIGEIIGGYLASSIAIMSDAAHLLSDLSAFGISIFSLFLVKRPATMHMTYGYHRAEIIGAVISVALIWGLTIWLVYSAAQRIIEPVEVDGEIMLITAVAGLACNLVMGLTLHHSHSHHHKPSPKVQIDDEFTARVHQENVNVRAALLHVLGDILQSVGVVIAGILICINEDWNIADPICTFLFSVIVLFTTIPIMKECIGVLMEGAPIGVDLDGLTDDLANITDVISVHDLHVWSLSIGKSSMSCHLVATKPVETLEVATRICREKYNISHATIQIEECESQLNCDNILHN